MFHGPWIEAVESDKPIEFGWSTATTVICLIHIYSGGTWLPCHQVPRTKAVVALLDKMQILSLVAAMTRRLWMRWL
ncbi:hypothetical protein BCR44DRAFT_1439155, partial [Catenaria anguillulae PL171]